jgi:ribosomal protein S18 acetylase RimI-like enzyme
MRSRNLLVPHIRPAERADLLQVAQLQVQAFGDKLRHVFPHRAVALTLLTASLEAEMQGHTHLVVAEEDGELVGLLALRLQSGFPAAALAGLRRLARQTVRPWHWPRLLIGQALLTHPTPPDALYIDVLAVAERQRGRGLGTALLAEAERYARLNGWREIGLHVSVHNSAARRLYTRQGFAVRDWQFSLASGLFLGHWGFAYMSKLLDPAA